MYEELLLTILLTSVPLVLAATGELVAERSGVLNLGVEGMMLMGAVSAFGAAILSGSATVGMIAGAFGGMMTAAIFGLQRTEIGSGTVSSAFWVICIAGCSNRRSAGNGESAFLQPQ